MPESHLQPSTSSLRRGKKSSSETDTIGVPNPDGLLQQQEEDEIDINDPLEELLASNSSPQMNVNVLRHRKKPTSRRGILEIPCPDGFIQQHEEYDEIDTNDLLKELLAEIASLDLDEEKEHHFLLGEYSKGEASEVEVEPTQSTIDVEAEQSSNNDLDHGEDAPNVTGLPSQSPNSKRSFIAEANKYLEWVFILTNLVLEILLVVLNQIAIPEKPQYALTALAVSLVAITVSVTELSFKAQKQKVSLKRQGMGFWLEYPPSSHNKPFYTFIDVFGFICAVSQFIFSAVAYSYHSRHTDSPVNINIVSVIFIICLVSSKLIKDLKETPVRAPV